MKPLERTGLVLAGLFGATGVAASAAGSHGGIPHLDIVGPFLLIHAAAIAALVALSSALSPNPRLIAVAGGTMAVGVAMFCGDLALRGLYGIRPVPFAAPAGGMITMLGWIMLALAAIIVRRTRH